jgi:hypothetical protein
VWPAALAVCALSWTAVAVAKPVSTTPGYPGLQTAPKLTSGAPTGSTKPGRPIHISQGYRPHVLVDDAGAAHITWSTGSVQHGPAGEHTYTAGWDNYCRLSRGVRSCGDHARFDAPITYPAGPGDTSPFFENSPGGNQDIGEGSLPLATGNQLLILAHRPGNVVAVPGGTSTDVNFVWSSDDGGSSFTGPGITSTMDYYGGAVVYGNPVSIGITGTTGALLQDDTTLGHVFFQGGAAGTYPPAAARADLGRGANNLITRHQTALDGDRPIVAFDDLRDVTVREYSGHGDINDAANWTTSRFPGVDPELASGPRGVWLTYYRPSILAKGVVVRLVHGHRSGPATPLFPSRLESQDNQLSEAGNGELVAGWTSKDPNGDNYGTALIATSANGRQWSKPQTLYHVGKRDGIDGLDLSTGPDGGGLAVLVHGSLHDPNVLGQSFSIGGQIVAIPYGARGSTGKKGLGGVGAGAPGQAGCLDLRFGAVHAHVDSGCFLRVIDPRDPNGHASIAYGGVHVNGLEIRPDTPGTSLVIDTDLHTIDSVGGTVSVLLQHPGVPDITLWDGSLHAYLGARDNSGDLLFPLPMSGFHANVLGFRALGTVNVILGAGDSVSMPMAVQLPAYFGVTGSATLRANMSDDLDRASLHIDIPDVVFPGLEVSHGAIGWTGPSEQWQGTAELQTQPGAGAAGMDVKGTQIAFDHGDYVSGGFTADPYPGTRLDGNAYLENLDAALDLHSPRSLTGNAEMGSVAHGDGIYSLEATGPLHTNFGTPSVMTVDGSGSVYGVPLTSAHAAFSTDGTFHETGTLGFDGFGITIGGSLDATTALAAGTTSGTINGGLRFGPYSVGQTIPFNDVGFGYCKSVGVGPASVSAGFVFKWNGGGEVHLDGCDSSLSGSGVASARKARAAEDGVTVSPGTAVEELDVRGAGGVPSVTLSSPGGTTIVPSATNVHAAAIALPVSGANLLALAIPHPARGVWHVSAAPGSAAIASVSAGRGYAPMTVSARVTGGGHRRVLVYRAGLHPSATVRFAEYRGSTLLAILGSARRASGRLRFTPAGGPAGPRRIVALIGGAGAVPRTVPVARYRAPGPARPAAGHVRVERRGRAFVVRIARAAGAARYLLTARTAGGRHVRTIVTGRRGTLTVPAAGWSDRIAVSVTPLSAAGVAGRSAHATLRLRIASPRYRAPRRSKNR